MSLLQKIQRLKIVDGLLVLGFSLVILGIGINFKDKFTEKEKAKIISNNVNPVEKSESEVNSEVMINISGEVINPGVYKLEKGAILDDVLTMAGGLSVKANLSWIDRNLNRAEKVYDGQKIYIPNKLDDKTIILQ